MTHLSRQSLVGNSHYIVTIDQEIVKSQRKTQSVILFKKIQIPKGFNGNLMKMNTVDVTLN